MTKFKPRRLTERFIAGLPQDGRNTYIVRDTKVAGLMVAVNKFSKTYKVQRDLWRGERGRRRLVKTVRITLGTTEEIPLEEARLKAQELIGQMARGIDPNEREERRPTATWTVEQLFHEYAADLRKRDCSERTIVNMMDSFERYVGDWRNVRLTELSRSIVRAKHQELSEKRGKVVANKAMRDLRAAYNLALRIVDNPDLIPDNPVKAVTFNKERRKSAVIMPDDLPVWWGKVQQLPNPLRRLMHELGLLSGLRPGTLVSLRRDWIDLEQRAISIPKMKSGRSFDLPLSARMVEVVRRALEISDTLYPGAPWLFPTRSARDQRSVICTQVWREKALPSETGHILRHTYRTIAQRIGIDIVEARLLLDHTVPGIDGVYIHETALFDRLLVAQERMSAEITRLITGKIRMVSDFGPVHQPPGRLRMADVRRLTRAATSA